MRELILLRHGKSDWREPLPDRLRPLKRRGKLAASTAGTYLRQHGHIPAQVISSPAERALHTAKLCLRAMQHKQLDPIVASSLYMGSIADHLDLLDAEANDEWPIMLVGHNPALDDLLVYLVGHDVPFREDGKLMTTASIARIELSDEWKHKPKQSGRLLELRRPTYEQSDSPSSDIEKR